MFVKESQLAMFPGELLIYLQVHLVNTIVILNLQITSVV